MLRKSKSAKGFGVSCPLGCTVAHNVYCWFQRNLISLVPLGQFLYWCNLFIDKRNKDYIHTPNPSSRLAGLSLCITENVNYCHSLYFGNKNLVTVATKVFQLFCNPSSPWRQDFTFAARKKCSLAVSKRKQGWIELEWRFLVQLIWLMSHESLLLRFNSYNRLCKCSLAIL